MFVLLECGIGGVRSERPQGQLGNQGEKGS